MGPDDRFCRSALDYRSTRSSRYIKGARETGVHSLSKKPHCDVAMGLQT